MTIPLTMLATVTVTALLIIVLRSASKLNDKSQTLAGRRRAGILQLSKWATLAVGVMVLAGEAFVAAGASSATMGLVGAAGMTSVAFALRESIADFLAAAALLAERTAAIGDEVELNAEVRGRLVGFGLRSVAVRTWDGDTVYHTASAIRTFRNISTGSSRAVVDIDIPPAVRTARATHVLTQALAAVSDVKFLSAPEVLGVVAQHLDRYVMRVTCMVEPAQHKEAEYRLKAAAVDAVAVLLDDHEDVQPSGQVAVIVAGDPHPLAHIP